MTPIWPLSYQTGTKFNIYKNQSDRKGKFTIFDTIVQIVNCQKILIPKSDPGIWPLLPVQTGSQSWISLKNPISTTARGKFTICALLYRSLIVKKYLQKSLSDPNLTFTSCPNRKSKFNIKTIISQQPQEVHFQFLNHCTDRYLSKNIYQKVTQFDLYFLSKPEVKVKYLQKSYLNNRKR